jgi:hypothetical protein
MKIGEKVKFSKYINFDYMKGLPLRYKISGKKTEEEITIPNPFGDDMVLIQPNSNRIRGNLRTQVIFNRNNNTVKYNTRVIADNILSGTFIGTFRKKLSREYRIEEPDTSPRRRIMATRPVNLNTYSTNPRRLDNPRELDTIAMVKYKNKLLGVPIGNIFMNEGNINIL